MKLALRAAPVHQGHDCKQALVVGCLRFCRDKVPTFLERSFGRRIDMVAGPEPGAGSAAGGPGGTVELVAVIEAARVFEEQISIVLTRSRTASKSEPGKRSATSAFNAAHDGSGTEVPDRCCWTQVSTSASPAGTSPDIPRQERHARFRHGAPQYTCRSPTFTSSSFSRTINSMPSLDCTGGRQAG